MIYVTEQNFRKEIRELHNLINTLAREVSVEIRNLQQENKDLKQVIEDLHSEQIIVRNELDIVKK